MKTRILLGILVLFGMAMTGCSSDDEGDTPVVINNAPHLNKSDSLTLIKIYNAIGPWDDPWDMNDITTWNGVTTALDLDTNELRVLGLKISGRTFHGSFPKEICDLSELRILILSGDGLTGQIPEEIGKLKKLEYLTLADNQMTGGIPESIGELTNLWHLKFTGMPLNDTIPESIGKLVNLEWLLIHDTKIHGNIPKGIANLKKLSNAWLNHNELSGVFPIEIMRGRITNICFEHNQITELPPEIWDDSFIGTPPLLQGNRLSGEVPEWVLKTKKWKEFGSLCVGAQQSGYGYTNAVFEDE